MKKVAIVVPTNRPERMRDFLAAWAQPLRWQRIYVVEDGPAKSFEVPSDVTHVSWAEIDADLGKDSWVIPRRTDAVRNYGFLLAAREHPEFIVTLDDDCLPESMDFIEQHRDALRHPGSGLPVYDTMTSSPLALRPRGLPSGPDVEVKVNMGLWNGVPDLDGRTQIRTGTVLGFFPDHSVQVPAGVLFPMSGMNLAFRPEVLPLLYFLPMGESQPYHRFGDIWCGWLMKKVCDRLGWGVRVGRPFVYHCRASEARRNAELEESGLGMNDGVWIAIHEAVLSLPEAPAFCLEVLYGSILDRIGGEYWKRCVEAHRIWNRLCSL